MLLTELLKKSLEVKMPRKFLLHRVSKEMYDAAKVEYGVDTGDVFTDLYCIHKGIKPKQCLTCSKYLRVFSFVNGWGEDKKFCSAKCKHSYNHTMSSSTEVFTDFEKLIDVNGNVSKSAKDKYVTPATIEHLQKLVGSDSTDVAYLLWKHIKKEPDATCAECANTLKFNDFKTPYRKNQKFCSDLCRDSNTEYREKLSETKKGISRYDSDTYVQNVLAPWFNAKVVEAIEKHKVIPQLTLEEFMELEKPKFFKFKCAVPTCGYEFDHATFSPRCRRCHPNSKQQDEITSLIAGMVGIENVSINNRAVIAPREIDIFAKSHNIGIEYDGFYYHNDKDDIDKLVACKSAGIRLVKIYEDEWRYKRPIVESRLASMFGKVHTKLYARKCVVAEIDTNSAREFLNENHIQGYVGSNVKYGLYHDGELVSVMTFGSPRFSKKHEWELLRFATVLNTTVVGGASKLLNKFVQEKTPKSLISYCDLRYGTGTVYNRLGFTKTHTSKHGYFWYRNGVRYSRMAFQKHKLSTVLKNYDQNLTEFQNMSNSGYYRIYDFGNDVYEIMFQK